MLAVDLSTVATPVLEIIGNLVTSMYILIVTDGLHKPTEVIVCGSQHRAA